MQTPNLEGLANGILLGGYAATRFKDNPSLSALRSVVVQAGGQAGVQLEAGVAYAKGTILARYSAVIGNRERQWLLCSSHPRPVARGPAIKLYLDCGTNRSSCIWTVVQLSL